MSIWTPQHRPSWKQGFARSASESAYPNLWKGLVGAWAPFLGPTGLTLHDVSGRYNHGTLTNGPTWVGSPGGGALSFDGSNDYVTITETFGASTAQPLSVLWRSRCRIANPTAEGIFYIPGNGAKFYGYHWDIDGQNGLWVRARGVIRELDGDIVQGDWHDFAAVWDSSDLTLYLDGIPQSASGDGGSDPIGSSTTLGRAHESFYGAIDLEYTLIYSRALTPNEIQHLYVDPYCWVRPRSRIWAAEVAVAAGNAPTGHLYGPLVGPFGGPI